MDKRAAAAAFALASVGALDRYGLSRRPTTLVVVPYFAFVGTDWDKKCCKKCAFTNLCDTSKEEQHAKKALLHCAGGLRC